MQKVAETTQVMELVTASADLVDGAEFEPLTLAIICSSECQETSAGLCFPVRPGAVNLEIYTALGSKVPSYVIHENVDFDGQRKRRKDWNKKFKRNISSTEQRKVKAVICTVLEESKTKRDMNPKSTNGCCQRHGAARTTSGHGLQHLSKIIVQTGFSIQVQDSRPPSEGESHSIRHLDTHHGDSLLQDQTFSPSSIMNLMLVDVAR